MKIRVHIVRWLSALIVLAVVVVLVGIPISYSLHTHTHSACPDGYAHAPETPLEWPEGSCELCVFYAYYAPREAQVFPAFSFMSAEVPWPVYANKRRAGKPCTAFVSNNANRGPPMAVPLA